MPGTITLGSLTYGPFTFPKALHASFRSIPIPDSTGRTIKYVRTTLRVDTVITPSDLSISGGSNFAETFHLVLAAISEPAQQISLTSIFLGGTITHTFAEDFEYGPTPQNISYEPIAGNAAYKLSWEVVYTRAICDTQQNVASMSADDSYDVGIDGCMTVTTTFVWEFTSKRTSRHTIEDKASAYLATARKWPHNNKGSEYTFNSTISPDRRILTIRVSCSEVKSDNPYFPYMIKMNVRESLRGGLTNGGLKKWSYRIGGSFDLAPQTPGNYGWIAFLKILQTRLNSISQSGNNSDGTKVVAIAPEFEWSNDIYGRSVTFSLSYIIVCDLSKILIASGIWKPVTGTSWQEWSTSMEEIQNPQGWAGLDLSVNPRNLVVDFCGSNTSVVQSSQIQKLAGKPYSSPSFSNQCPPESTSWVEFENKVIHDRATNTINHYPLSPGEAQFTRDVDDQGKITTTTGGSGGSSGSVRQPHVQSRGASVNFVSIYGHGVRIGYAVPIPKITKIGNTTPVLHTEKLVASHIVGWSGNCPIYRADWVRTYRYYSTEDGQTPTIEGIPPGNKKS